MQRSFRQIEGKRNTKLGVKAANKIIRVPNVNFLNWKNTKKLFSTILNALGKRDFLFKTNNTVFVFTSLDFSWSPTISIAKKIQLE